MSEKKKLEAKGNLTKPKIKPYVSQYITYTVTDNKTDSKGNVQNRLDDNANFDRDCVDENHM